MRAEVDRAAKFLLDDPPYIDPEHGDIAVLLWLRVDAFVWDGDVVFFGEREGRRRDFWASLATKWARKILPSCDYWESSF